jgi:predicted GNAT family acetyltransferase/predicted nucleic acid-binding protein
VKVDDNIKTIRKVSDILLDDIVVLADANRATLGFMPAAAFKRFADEEKIIAAVSSTGELRGYLLYRPTKGRLSITHCCVADSGRGMGIGQTLVKSLLDVAVESKSSSVFLKCRSDYGIDEFWRGCGFQNSHDLLGRSRHGSRLNVWVFTISEGELFTWAGGVGGNDRARISVAVDLNVYIDLCGRRGENSESRGLLADWIEEEAALCRTPVLEEELLNSTDYEEMKVQLDGLSEIDLVMASSDRLKSTKASFIEHWPGVINSQNDRYDFEHICSAIAADVDVFVTRDERLISYCDAISDRLPIRVCRPSELIADIHEGGKLESGSPLRVQGLGIYETLLTNSQNLERFSDCSAFRSRESKRQLEAKLRDLIAHPHLVRTYCLKSLSDNIEAIYSLREISDEVIEIELLRIANSINELAICEKALRARVEAVASHGSSRLIKITDSIAVSEYRETLSNLGFFITSDGIALRLSLAMQLTKKELEVYLSTELIKMDLKLSHDQVNEFGKALRDGLKRGGLDDLANLETVLFPVKLLDANFPCYIVPVRANWARELFDDELAEMDIFAPLKLGSYCNFENAYFHNSPVNMAAPSRVLWYISGGDMAQGHLTQRIRHTSLVREVRVDRPKELYKRFKGMGVYEWKDIFAAAQNDLNRSLKAFRFSSTGKILTECSKDHFTKLGICGEIYTVRSVSEEQYFKIYNHSV